MSPTLCYIAIGSNLASPLEQVNAALAAHGAMKPEGFIHSDFHAIKIVYDFF